MAPTKPMTTIEDIVKAHERSAEKNRLRQKKHYEAHKNEILEKKKEERRQNKKPNKYARMTEEEKKAYQREQNRLRGVSFRERQKLKKRQEERQEERQEIKQEIKPVHKMTPKEQLDHSRELSKTRSKRYRDNKKSVVREAMETEAMMEQDVNINQIDKKTKRLRKIPKKLKDYETSGIEESKTTQKETPMKNNNIKKTVIKRDLKLIDYDEKEYSKVEEFLKKSKTGSTLKTYLDTTKRLLRITNCKILYECLINETALIINKIINSDFSNNTKKLMFQIILFLIDNRYFEEFPNEIKELYLDQFNELKLKTTKEVEVKKQNEKVENFDNYIQRVKSIFGESSKEYALIKLYDAVPARDDFGKLKLIKKNKIETLKNNDLLQRDERDNFLNITESKNYEIILTTFKTDTKYKTISRILDNETTKLLKQYINKNKIDIGDYVFTKKRSRLSQFITKLNKKLNIDAGINFIRHSKISTEINKLGIDDDKERIELTKQMLHSIFAQQGYERKLK